MLRTEEKNACSVSREIPLYRTHAFSLSASEFKLRFGTKISAKQAGRIGVARAGLTASRFSLGNSAKEEQGRALRYWENE